MELDIMETKLVGSMAFFTNELTDSDIAKLIEISRNISQESDIKVHDEYISVRFNRVHDVQRENLEKQLLVLQNEYRNAIWDTNIILYEMAELITFVRKYATWETDKFIVSTAQQHHLLGELELALDYFLDSGETVLQR